MFSFARQHLRHFVVIALNDVHLVASSFSIPLFSEFLRAFFASVVPLRQCVAFCLQFMIKSERIFYRVTYNVEWVAKRWYGDMWNAKEVVAYENQMKCSDFFPTLSLGNDTHNDTKPIFDGNYNESEMIFCNANFYFGHRPRRNELDANVNLIFIFILHFCHLSCLD